MGADLKRFSCTQCGKCCNRPPQLGLSEASTFAGIFVFRLMFRLYRLPQRLSEYLAVTEYRADANAIFHQKKRLMSNFAAREYPVKVGQGGTKAGYTNYLMISALPLDTSPGACRALKGEQCSVYDRRPVSCRSVPFHYSHPEALAETGLDSFVGTPGYRCDTSETAEVVLQGGRIVSPEIKVARADAALLAQRQRRWSKAIVRRMHDICPPDLPLPTFEIVEANARLGITTTSMRVAWKVAVDAGIMTAEECDRLIRIQLTTIEQELAAGRFTPDVTQTLAEMRAEYQQHV